MHRLSGISWPWVLVTGVLFGCFNLLMRRLMKRPPPVLGELEIPAAAFLAELWLPRKDVRDLLLGITLGFVIEAIVGLAWSRMSARQQVEERR